MLILSLNQVLGAHPPSTLENCHLKASHPDPPHKNPLSVRAFCPRAARKFAKKPMSYLIRVQGTHIITFDGMKHNTKLLLYIVPTQTIYYYSGKPSKIPHNLHCLIPLKMGNVMPRVFMNTSLLDYCRCSFGIIFVFSAPAFVFTPAIAKNVGM